MVAEVVVSRFRGLSEVCVRLGVERLDMFGSGSTDAWRAGVSDVDFMVEFFSGEGDRGRLVEELGAVLGCAVNVVTPAVLVNPFFAKGIEETRLPVFRAEFPDRCPVLVSRAAAPVRRAEKYLVDLLGPVDRLVDLGLSPDLERFVKVSAAARYLESVGWFLEKLRELDVSLFARLPHADRLVGCLGGLGWFSEGREELVLGLLEGWVPGFREGLVTVLREVGYGEV